MASKALLKKFRAAAAKVMSVAETEVAQSLRVGLGHGSRICA
ncbi:hypothetical protein J2W14_002512 [Pseudarthrobacter oxydans]|nr:hypothetical protein [Pseudarthrobacter oxydans]MDP9983110.1 hypothetical protein [Pseudarthrobacter oxydans]